MYTVREYIGGQVYFQLEAEECPRMGQIRDVSFDPSTGEHTIDYDWTALWVLKAYATSEDDGRWILEERIEDRITLNNFGMMHFSCGKLVFFREGAIISFIKYARVEREYLASE